MPRNKRRKPKFTQATLPRSERNQTHIDGGKQVFRYDPGRNPAPRNHAKDYQRSRPQQRGG